MYKFYLDRVIGVDVTDFMSDAQKRTFEMTLKANWIIAHVVRP